jgi:hypothetical protein
MTFARLTARQPTRPQVVLSIEFEARDGSRWRAIGGGSSLDEAIAFARAGAPDGRSWIVVRIEDLYGD